MSETKTFVNALMPVSLAADLQKIAVKRNVSRSDVVRWVMESYIRQHQNNPEAGLHAPTSDLVNLFVGEMD